MNRITNEMIGEWSKEYRESSERQLATMALSKTNLSDVSYVSS